MGRGGLLPPNNHKFVINNLLKVIRWELLNNVFLWLARSAQSPGIIRIERKNTPHLPHIPPPPHIITTDSIFTFYMSRQPIEETVCRYSYLPMVQTTEAKTVQVWGHDHHLCQRCPQVVFTLECSNHVVTVCQASDYQRHALGACSTVLLWHL